MAKRCCWCSAPIEYSHTYFSGDRNEACSARHAVMHALRSIKKPRVFYKEFYDELIESDSARGSETERQAE